jgi:hypothetical protein
MAANPPPVELLRARSIGLCPQCSCGYVRKDPDGGYSCDGLMDPEDPNKPLEACNFWVVRPTDMKTAQQGKP